MAAQNFSPTAPDDSMMADSPGGRLVFASFEFSRFPNGLYRAEVQLERPDGETITGIAEGSGTKTAGLRCAAQASVSALQKVTPPGRAFELLGVKAVSAFDSTIVIVSVGVRLESGPRRFVGSYVAAESSERAAAIAVLNATNRVLNSGVIARS